MQHSSSFGIPANTSSHGSESASPCLTSQKQKEAADVVESSGSSEEEEGRRGLRINWSEDDNIRLMSAWLKHSVDPIHGNDKKTEHYWKVVADEFNENLPSNGHKRTPKQCRVRGNVRRDCTKFSGCISKAKSTFTSGYSDDMIKQTAYAWFKKGSNERSFTLEYIWKDLKDQLKWKRILQEGTKNKRNKISESGAYTSSSNQDTEEETLSKEKRPEGQKAAKQRLKGKGLPSPLGDTPCQNMVLFHEAVTQRAAALLKSAEAMVLSAEAKKESARAKQEKARAKKFSTYLKLSEQDTSKYNEKQLKRHNDILEKLGRELAEE